MLLHVSPEKGTKKSIIVILPPGKCESWNMATIALPVGAATAWWKVRLQKMPHPPKEAQVQSNLHLFSSSFPVSTLVIRHFNIPASSAATSSVGQLVPVTPTCIVSSGQAMRTKQNLQNTFKSDLISNTSGFSDEMCHRCNWEVYQGGRWTCSLRGTPQVKL